MAILYDIDAEIHGKSAADRFLGDGRIEIDSNAVEPVNAADRLNRKNGPFAGYDLGAENWAVLASLIETCKLHGMNPEAWLAGVIARLVELASCLAN